MGPMYYDRDGNPCDMETWVAQFEDINGRIIGRTEFEVVGHGTVLISTVWLGLDHNFLRLGPPYLWETMVFGSLTPGDEQDERDYTARYASRAEAEAGHGGTELVIIAELEAAGAEYTVTRPHGLTPEELAERAELREERRRLDDNERR
jgi:hypothetical protein